MARRNNWTLSPRGKPKPRLKPRWERAMVLIELARRGNAGATVRELATALAFDVHIAGNRIRELQVAGLALQAIIPPGGGAITWRAAPCLILGSTPSM